MGTIVLPPQDCLSSPHNRQNAYLSSARSNIGRSSFQAAMVASPSSEDCARHKHGGGSPPGDGLLPIPVIHGQARILSKGSPPKASSPFCSPPVQRRHPGPSPRMKSSLSRSASAILPTPLVGSPPLGEGLLKGRLPFKIVQGNGPGNKNDSVPANLSKKPNDVRSGARKGITAAASNHASNKKATRNLEKLKSTSKVPLNGDVIRGQPKTVDVKIRSLERSSSAKGVCEKSEIAEVPVVTILQRPQTEEAAAELFAKFFQNGTKQMSVNSSEGGEALSCNSTNLCVINKEESDNHLAVEEHSVFESPEGRACRTTNSLLFKGMANVKKDVKVPTSADAECNAVPVNVGVGVHFNGGIVQNTKGLVFETGCEELAPWERWAGPAYINSPPPSALPLPRFSKKHLNVVTVGYPHDEHMEEVPNQISTSPSSNSPLYASLARQRHLNINLDAVATATKDLRRILNLDLCRV